MVALFDCRCARTACCSLLQSVAVCCSVKSRWWLSSIAGARAQRVAVCGSVLQCSVLQCVAVCCSELQCVAVRGLDGGSLRLQVNVHRMWQCVAVSCSVLQCVAVCCSVLQCVAV